MKTGGFTLYLAGAEIPGWRKLLAEVESPMAVSYWGLQRRLPKTKPYLLAEQFEGDYPLFLDAGGHSANTSKKAAEMSRQDLLEYADRYESFVSASIGRVTMVSEFDATVLGYEWLMERRAAFYDHLDPAKFMPIWHEDHGVDALREMAAKYEVLGVSTTETVTGRNLQPVLQSIARTGVRLHGMAMTKPDVLRVIPFASASSTSWLSPNQYGDTIVWDGTALHRYPRDYKERSRRQHKMLIERAGFDADKVLADDSTEVARFTIWSWRQQAEAIARLRGSRGLGPSFSEAPEGVEGQIADITPLNQEGGNVQNPHLASVTTLPDTVKSPPVRKSLVANPRSARQSLPVLGIEVLRSEETDADGNPLVNERRLMRAGSASGRVCNNCYLAEVCPLYEPDMECGYDIPVEARTKEQRVAIMEGVIEWQTQRVAFLKLAEDRNGGYADPNLSTEMDRLFKLISVKKEVEDDRDSFEMTIKSRGQATTLERLFGGEAPPRHPQVDDRDPIKVIEHHAGPLK